MPSDDQITIGALKKKAKQFVQERDWHQFHTPKNMSMNISGEAAELMEHFIWVDSKDSLKELEENRDSIEQEVADVAFALLDFCNYCNIDLATVFDRKLQLTAEKYPIEKSKGKYTKYTKL